MARRRGAPVQPDVDDDDPREKKTRKLTSGNADVDAAAALLEWARRRGYIVGPALTVGGVTMQVRDLRIMKREGFVDQTNDEDDEDDEAEGGLMHEHGAPDAPVPEGTTG